MIEVLVFSTYPPCPMTGSIFTFCCTLSPFFSLAEQIPCHSYKWNVGIIIHCVQNINPRAFSTSGFHSFTMATKAIRIIKSSQPQRQFWVIWQFFLNLPSPSPPRLTTKARSPQSKWSYVFGGFLLAREALGPRMRSTLSCPGSSSHNSYLPRRRGKCGLWPCIWEWESLRLGQRRSHPLCCVPSAGRVGIMR